MQWGQIKVLFILSFLILDLYLLQQFLDKQKEAEVGNISLSESEGVEMEIENSGITIGSDALPADTPDVPTIKSENKNNFSEEILSQIETLEDEGKQDIKISNNILKSTLKDPVKVNEDNVIEKVDQVVPFSDQYSYWGWNEEKKAILFFQKANGKTVYFNQGGFLQVLVQDGEITGYLATLLSFSDISTSSTQEKKTKLIEPYTIIKHLLEEGKIDSGDRITKMKVGYHNNINLNPWEERGPQAFAPTWKIMVNSDQFYFVYATDGKIIDINEDEFIESGKELWKEIDNSVTQLNVESN